MIKLRDDIAQRDMLTQYRSVTERWWGGGEEQLWEGGGRRREYAGLRVPVLRSQENRHCVRALNGDREGQIPTKTCAVRRETSCMFVGSCLDFHRQPATTIAKVGAC